MPRLPSNFNFSRRSPTFDSFLPWGTESVPSLTERRLLIVFFCRRGRIVMIVSGPSLAVVVLQQRCLSQATPRLSEGLHPGDLPRYTRIKDRRRAPRLHFREGESSRRMRSLE